MADLNKQRIQTLTQTSQATPQLQTNSSSLGGDLVNAAAFGLDIYNKNKAQGELESLAKQQSLFQSKVSKGVSSFEQLQRELEASDVSSARANARINGFLKGFSSEERNAILKGTKELSGTSALGSITDAESEALARQEGMFELQTTAAQLSPFSTQPIIDIEASSDDELRSYIINATANKAKLEREVATLEATRTSTANQNALDLKIGGIEYRNFALNSIVSQAKMITKGINLQDPKSREEAMMMIRDLKQRMPSEFENYMLENKNIPVGASQTAEALAPINTMLDSLMSDVMGTDAVKLGENTVSSIVQGMVMSAYDKQPEKVQKFLLAKDLGFPLQGVTDVAFASMIDIARNASTKNTDALIDDLRDDLDSKGVTGKEQDDIVKTTKEMMFKSSNSYKDLTPVDKADLTQSLLQDLNPSSQADLIRSMQSGTILERIKELANPDSAETYSESAEEIGNAVKRSSDLVLQTLGTKFFTAKTQGIAGAMAGNKADAPLGDKYKYDSSKGQFVLRDPRSPAMGSTKVVNGLNGMIKNTLKAYENLGLSERSEQLKEELTQLFGEDDAS